MNITSLKTELYLLYRQQELLLKQQYYKLNLFALCGLCGFSKIEEYKTELHQDLCQILMKTSTKARRVFILPRGHYKTSIIGIVDTIWHILQNPNIRILICCSTLENAKEMLGVIINVFRYNTKFREVFPEFCPPEDAKEWGTQTKMTVCNRTDRNLKEATVEIAGVGNEITGRHYNRMKFSDLVTEKTINTLEQIKKTKKWAKYIISLLENPARDPIDIEGTIYDYRDMHQEWLDDDDKTIIKFYKPGTDENYSFCLCPEILNIDDYKKIRKEQGSFIFASQYLLKGIDEENAPFKYSQIKYVARANFPQPARSQYKKRERLSRFIAVDPAATQNKDSDDSIITTAFFDKDNVMYIEDIKHGKWKAFELIKKLYATHEHYNSEQIAFEKVSFQETYFNIIEEEVRRGAPPLPIRAIERNTHKSKNQRIMGLQPRFENHKIFFADDLDKGFIEDSLLRFKPFSKANKDDLLDTLVDLDRIKYLPEPDEDENQQDNLLFSPKKYADYLAKYSDDEDYEFEGKVEEVDNFYIGESCY